MELIDEDFRESEDELIDRFAINITSLGPTKDRYDGIFGLAAMDVTTEIACKLERCEFLLGTTAAAPRLLMAVLPPFLSVILLAIIVSAVFLTVCIIKRKKRKASCAAVEYQHRSAEESESHNSALDPTVSLCFCFSHACVITR